MIYLDYAASAPSYPQAAGRVCDVMREAFGNPGALHSAGGESRLILQQSRRELAQLLGVRDREIFFTSGGTESNNWAIKLGCLQGKGRHIVVGATEHKSVLESARAMAAWGYSISYVYPDPQGRIQPKAVEALLRPDTALISVQAVNNETGVIQDVAALAALARKWGVLYHCDGVQSFGHLSQPLYMADFLSVSAHKLAGPAGVGCLVIRQPHMLPPLLHGGGQELGLRSGTENVPGIAGFATAAMLSVQALPAEAVRQKKLSEQLIRGILSISPQAQIVAAGTPRHPGIVSCLFPGCSAEEIAMRLDLKGICVSTGAACAARDPAPSHVLLAMGYSKEQAGSAIRFSFGHGTTPLEIDQTIQALAQILRSPIRKEH